ncbi:methyltransferase type 11 [Sporocytophaga myxococcoides]|uniref:Methyltransferase type 11 n=1 Tax=Sporocytophaga myxococcoides TaxID=153721 RepID=A0A098LH01_9BACT|nr:class I SAM-dependent methyltransferase [Sporocytophaga myxococcoides]GAL85433.1 methyltransferase type 11 [Sporocytophaga myxococcoides]
MNENKIKWNSSLYDTKHQFVSEFGEDLVTLLNPKKGEHILDLGCGTGQLAAAIAASGALVEGSDHSEDMIRTAIMTYPHIPFRVEDAEAMDDYMKYDAVFSNAVFHWIANPQKVVCNVYNALKHGGRFVAEFGGKGNVQQILNALNNSFIARKHTENSNIKFWYFPSIGEFTSLLENSGFRVIYAVHFDRPTELTDNVNGVKDWFRMFGEKFFKGLSEQEIEGVLDLTQNSLMSRLFRDGKWFADYVRIRIIAIKQ